MTDTRWAIDIDRDDIAEAVLVEEAEPPLADGQVEVRVPFDALLPGDASD